MPDATIKRLDEMESFYDGLVTRARAELGVTSWGMQVFDLPPHFDQYPNHHHGEGGGEYPAVNHDVDVVPVDGVRNLAGRQCEGEFAG